MHFSQRQANSVPLGFNQTDTGDAEFEFDALLARNGLFVTTRQDLTSDLQRSYAAAKSALEAMANRSDGLPANLQAWLDAFAALGDAAGRKDFRLVWWSAAKRPDYSLECVSDRARPLATLVVGPSGFRYPDSREQRPLLDALNLTVRPGEYMGLIGRTGAGKTTLFNGLMGYLAPKTGIQRSVTGNVGLVAQDPILFADMTVQLHIEMGLRLNRSKKDTQSRRSELISLLMTANLERLANNRVETLSRGQKQRVAIATAVAAGPDILLFDEPLASQDAIERENLIQMFRQLRAARRLLAMVHVSHVWEDLVGVDRLIEISGGQLIEIPAGDCQSLFQL